MFVVSDGIAFVVNVVGTVALSFFGRRVVHINLSVSVFPCLQSIV
jgi:hypothetical protein